mgnify:FL=1
MDNLNKGMLIVISSPSGAGKTSICKKLIEIDDKIHPSISVTTREPRKNEINGIDYIFTTVEDFKKKISKNEFLEYADVFNNKYGTLISSTKLLADKGYDVLFDIDWQGTQQLSQVEENILTIFILPPSKKEIEKRLKKRESENFENSNIVKDRMLKFEDELSHWKEYDYVVTNDNFDNCVKEIANIINVERIKRANKKSIITKIRDLKD